MGEVTVRPALDAGDVATAGAMFREYQASLVETEGPAAEAHMCFQDFEAELGDLAAMYGAPRGALLLAHDGDEAMGCVGVRPTAMAGVCEMKRLYLRPGVRGSGTGRRLAEAALDAARALGYREMVLETLPSMRVAIRLYRSLGFAARDADDEGTAVVPIHLARTL